MTAPVSSAPAPEAGASASALRMSLAPLGSKLALLDGAWWPRSRDLAAELPQLVAALDPLWGRITRITVNPTHWPSDFPRRVPVEGHVVKVGWFLGEQDPHQLLLLSYRTARWDLLVVPLRRTPSRRPG